MDKHPKHTILIVDDEETNIDILVEILGDRYDLSIAMDGNAAIESIAENPPNLILLDIMMPDMDGHEVCKRIKADEKTRSIPVIFVTVMTDEIDELKGFELGAVDYITKPLSPPIIRARVRTHLALNSARKNLERQNKQLHEAARLREEVESIMRHDLKTPLSVIIGIPQLLLIKEERDPAEARQLRLIEQAGYRILQMLNLSLDLMKMERGSYCLQPTAIDLLDLLEKITREMESPFKDKHLTLVVTVNGRPPENGDVFLAFGEELLCYAMLSNLLKNAYEASPQDCQVGIDFRYGPLAEIRIRNSGTVLPAIRDRFFDKYVTAKEDKGTGLGTYSAKLTAETQGGTISLDTSEAGHTTVTVRLPVPP